MAVIYMENFEWASGEVPLSQRYIITNSSNVSLSNADSMYGTCVKIGSTPTNLGTAIRLSLDSINQFLFSFAIKRDTIINPASDYIWGTFDAGNTGQTNMIHTSSGTIKFMSGGSTFIAETTPISFSTNRERYELGMYLHASTGTLSFKRNGSLLCSITGIKTNGDSSTISSIRLGGLSGTNVYYDDFYVDNDKNAFRGDVRIHSLYPTGYTQQQSTPNTGLYSWANIDESPIATGDYATFSGGQFDVYNLSSLTGNPYIYSVGILTYAAKMSADVASGRQGLTMGSASISGGLLSMSVASGFVGSYFANDPSGNPWTKNAVNTCLLSFGKEIL